MCVTCIGLVCVCVFVCQNEYICGVSASILSSICDIDSRVFDSISLTLSTIVDFGISVSFLTIDISLEDVCVLHVLFSLSVCFLL